MLRLSRNPLFVASFTGFLVVSMLFLVLHQMTMDKATRPDTTSKVTTNNLEVPRHKSYHERRYIDDESGAIPHFRDYGNRYESRPLDEKLINTANITTWWQAAAMIDWYLKSPLRYKCQNKVAYGNWDLCQDEKYEVKPPCLVYSFGIANEFSFDDAMGKLGCEVHSFDPSMGVQDHKRSPNITFHNLAIGAIITDGFIARRDRYVKNRQVWRMRTLKTIMKSLGHENRVLDVLKIDVESYEWNVVENMMETDMFLDIRQFMVEFHLYPDYPLKEDYVRCYKVYKRLREMGLLEYSVRPHPKVLEFKNQGHSEFVNANFHW